MTLLFVVAWNAAVVSSLVLPAAAACAYVTRRRAVAPLLRGSLERASGLGASLWGALSILALEAVIAHAAGAFRLQPYGMLLVGFSPVLGLVPWLAGEMISGPSRRAPLALAASVTLAAAAGWGAAAVVWRWWDWDWNLASGWRPLWLAMPPTLMVLICCWLTYLALRGGELHSSSMSEKRSLLGSSLAGFCPGCCGCVDPGCAVGVAGRCDCCAGAGAPPCRGATG